TWWFAGMHLVVRRYAPGRLCVGTGSVAGALLVVRWYALGGSPAAPGRSPVRTWLSAGTHLVVRRYAALRHRVLRFRKDPLPGRPVNFPPSTTTRPLEMTVSVAPMTSRPSYGL